MEPPKKIFKPSDGSKVTELHLSIPPSFQPTGISYQHVENRTMLIVQGVNEILTFLLGDLRTILSTPNAIKPLKENLIQVESSVLKIIHSKVRTYCLHEDQSLSSFASYKQLKQLKSPSGCRDIIKYRDGVAVLVKNPRENLRIELLPDTNNENPSKIVDCGPAVDDESYFLGQFVVSERNLSFLSAFLGVSMPVRKDPFLLFSVGNNIFWINDTEDDEIRIIRSYSSKIMRFFMKNSLFIAILESGTMEISYLCSLLGVVGSKRFHLFENCWSLCTEKLLAVSNGNELHEIEVKQMKNDVKIDRKVTKLPGIVGIVFVKEVNRLLSITENRFMYHWEVTTKEFAVGDDDDEFQLVDDKYLLKANSVKNLLQKLLEVHKTYQKTIDEKQSRHELLENFRSKRFSSISSQNSYLESIPRDLKNYVHNLQSLSMDQNLLFLVVDMKIDDLRTILCIENTFILFEYSFEGKIRKRFIRLKDFLSDEKSKILFDVSQKGHLSLPEMKISLVHLIRQNTDLLMLKTDVKTKTEDLKQEIVSDEEVSKITKTNENSLIKRILGEEIKNSSEISFSHSLKVPNSNILLNNFNLSSSNNRSVIKIHGKFAILELIHEEDVLKISSPDFGLVNYLKNLILRKIFEQNNFQKISFDSNFERKMKEFLPILTSTNINDRDVLEYYRKIRELPIEFSAN
ncbi:uncharacterized protein LOC134828408 [Culicoides brevitarsis]|uniref:uncharacterized protein LOC134828408 n=1 Tax=Culicoides brevitarsis TaxID=469753 RepID=UPI00307B8C01